MNKNNKTIVVVWQRLISDGSTCPRCGSTEENLEQAVLELKEKLKPYNIDIVLEKKELTVEEFKKDSINSNSILFEGVSLEKLISANIGQSKCCDVCGDAECRAVEIKGSLYEIIPIDLIVRAGLIAVFDKFNINLL